MPAHPWGLRGGPHEPLQPTSLRRAPGHAERPAKAATWLLGSSPNGSHLAGGLGIGYTFAGFINPQGAAPALRNQREVFRPRFALEPPRAILAVNVTVGETESDAQRLVCSPKGFYARLSRAGRGAGSVMVPAPDEVADELNTSEREDPITIVDGHWPRFVAGSPRQVRATLEQIVEESGADEVMAQDLIADPTDRRRSRALLADAFAL
jgi:alkanesulfonate monooxygenase SsuD/methylene tetrahydromethanopterin reductase-like flavin-dependent oxidoreductase (luciferase family)